MNIFQMLSVDEGLRLDVYKDTEGYWTVGIGHLLTKNPSKAIAIQELDRLVGRSTNGVITKDEAELIFKKDVDKAILGIKSNSTLAQIYAGLDDVRRDALVNMTFQLGVAGVAGFRKGMAAISAKDWKRAEVELKDSRWFKSQTPARAGRVIGVMCTGTYKGY